MANRLKVYIKNPGCKPRETEIENTLNAFQEAVGGYIEFVRVTTDSGIICNEEGAINGMPYNCKICGMYFFGTILFVGVEDEEFVDYPADFLDFHAAFRNLFYGKEE